MEKTFSLSRTKQCAKCPWKVDTDPFEIPDGYCPTKHANLANTISDGSLRFGGNMNVMACHHSKEGAEEYCIGWLHNQMGVGNNIGLRMQMMRCANLKDVKTYGEQHERFEDTIPY